MINPFYTPDGYNGLHVLDAFQKEAKSEKVRRLVLNKERPQGVLTANYVRTLEELQKSGKLNFIIANIDKAMPIEGKVDIQLMDGQRLKGFDQVLLATGYTPGVVPGGKAFASLKTKANLPVYEDGYPALSPNCEWRQGLFVMGPLAEHVVGPNALNLAGGQIAAERIAQSQTMQQLIQKVGKNQGLKPQ